MRKPIGSHTRKRAFVLLEALLAVAIFALGVIALGRCVSNCLVAERIRSEDTLARRALANRMASIESGAAVLGNESSEDLASPFDGMKLTQKKVPVAWKNENDQALSGLAVVTLDVSWQSAGERHTRSLIFYTHERKP